MDNPVPQGGKAPAYETFLRTRTFGSLDGIRFLSIVAVVLFHSAQAATGWEPLDTAVNRGFLGVDMFFVLSGFLIVTLLLREKGKTGTVAIGAFYLRRALRILPPWALLLGGMAVLYGWITPSSPSAQGFFAGLPYNLTFTSNWVETAGITGTLWSLSTEEQFYLVWPMVQKHLSPRQIVVVLVLVIAVNQLFNFRVFPGPHDALNVLQATFTPIALGALLANVLDRPKGFAAVYRWLGFRGAPVWCFVGLAVLLAWPQADISGVHRLAIQLTMAAFLASTVVRADHALTRVLGWAPVARLGKVSYGVYLYHLVALVVVGAGMKGLGIDHSWGRAFLTLGFSWVLAEVSYRFWETPFLKLKDRIAGPRPPSTPVSPPSR